MSDETFGEFSPRRCLPSNEPALGGGWGGDRFCSVFDRLSQGPTAAKRCRAGLLAHRPSETSFKNGENGRNGQERRSAATCPGCGEALGWPPTAPHERCPDNANLDAELPAPVQPYAGRPWRVGGRREEH